MIIVLYNPFELSHFTLVHVYSTNKRTCIYLKIIIIIIYFAVERGLIFFLPQQVLCVPNLKTFLKCFFFINLQKINLSGFNILK